MRVITGKYKGRTLVAPKDQTRPTLDRTKETLFNILNPLISGANVLDLFAGSGQIAIEFISRGCNKAYLCDNNKSAIQAIKDNFSKIGQTPLLFTTSYQDCLSQLQNADIDIVFLDPPYQSGYYCDCFEKMLNYKCLSDNAVVICEHSVDVLLQEQYDGFVRYDYRKIGNVAFSFYKRS